MVGFIGPYMTRLPTFFIVGAPKAGTTSLYYYLDQHPQVHMSAIKEPNFFSAEIRGENCEPELRRSIAGDARRLREYLDGPMRQKRFGGIVEDWEDYLRLYANAGDETALGEASVSYLWSPSAAGLIAERIPDAKIIVMLRDPVERAFSQYLHGVANGAIHWSFHEHVQRNLRHRSGQFCVDFPFLEYGLYARQLERYLERFGKNVWIGFHADFTNRPLTVFQEICGFLGVSTDFSPDMNKHHLEAQVPRVGGLGWLRNSGFWRVAARMTPAGLRPLIRSGLMRKPRKISMDPADRDHLAGYYREDVERLASVLGRDLSGWTGRPRTA
jgi:hypothetical protein